jgi:hypothetical protein
VGEFFEGGRRGDYWGSVFGADLAGRGEEG